LLKSKIILALKKKYPNLKKVQFESIINIFTSSVAKALLDGQNVEFRSLGTLSVKEIDPKFNARNPKTGEIIYIPKKNKIYFKMSKQLKNEINNG